MRSLHKIVGLSFTIIMASSVAALAEAPQCPGGGVAKGTFHCSGPVLHPVCTEGPPWTCSLPAASGMVMQLGEEPKPVKPRPGHHSGTMFAF